MVSEGERIHGERTSARPTETSVPKPRKKNGPVGEEGDAKRRRKPKATVEVDNSTFTELRNLVQEMRPNTLQVRLETVLLAKKKQGEEVTKRKRKKPEAGSTGVGVPTKTLDIRGTSPPHSQEKPTQSNEKTGPGIPREAREPSESSEALKSRLPVTKREKSPAHRDWDKEIIPKREKERENSPRMQRERDKSPKLVPNREEEDEELTKDDTEDSE
ncbi:hypothetical protein R1sor_006068 [Riccia sorocarpa]|uniref:Uncharacterized protein n=1 Tax=Riccia sorocarpa TaxID=122646 RepID=A0ABD3HLK8_9MARC